MPSDTGRPDPKLLAIAAIVNGYYNEEAEPDALAAFRALRAIADALGPPLLRDAAAACCSLEDMRAQELRELLGENHDHREC